MATIGTIGKYERLDVLGHGTSGVVYLAWDTLLRRNVALKEIRAAGPEMERVLDEARVLDRLGRHPHIVEVHSVDTISGAILIDMELVRGVNLADLLRDRKGEPLPPTEAVRIAASVLDALAFAHERRILHRDIKPANILVGTDGAVKLTDFGLAEALGSGSVAGGGGTYPYMAPEDFAENAESDYRSDLWAVGVMAYEMLTGRRPFQVAQRTRDPFAWKRAITEEDPPPLRLVRPELPGDLERVVAKALNKDKADRYPTARAFAVELRAAISEMPVSARIVAPPPTAATPRHTEATSEDHVFYFSSGASATDLDSLLTLCARHWDEARVALADGRLEWFLRAIGEVYISELAADLRARPGDPDKSLREFLERSRTAEEPADDRTIPAGAVQRLRPQRLLRRGDDRAERRPSTPPEDRTVAAPLGLRAFAPAAAHTESKAARAPSAGWFWPLYVVSVAPLGISVTGAFEAGITSEQQSIHALLGWGGFGFLNALLLIVAVQVRIGKLGRALCGVAIGGGLIATGALVSLALSGGPTTQSLVSVTILLMIPVAVLVIVAVTVGYMWRFWAWLTLVFAIIMTLEFARPGLPRVVQFSHTHSGFRGERF